MGASSQKSVGKKVAICTFRNRVCPRFDLTHEILIFDLDHSRNPAGQIHTSLLSPEDKLRILAEKRIDTLIVGGMQQRFQEMFLNHQIEVIWGVIGEITDVLQAYSKGTLRAGIGLVGECAKKRGQDHVPNR